MTPARGTPRVLVLTSDMLEIDLGTLDTLREHADVVVAVDRESLRREIRQADIMFVWDFRFADLDELLPTAANLAWIHAAAVGVDALLTENLTRRGIVLTNSRGVFDRAIAEYVLGLYLMHIKDFRTTLQRQGRQRWEHRTTGKLAGRRALVVGTGSIGREIARFLAAVEVRVTLVGRRRATDPEFGEIAHTWDLETLVSDADLLVLAAPLTPESRHMVDRRVLEAMPAPAYLINVGRGPLLDEAALVDVLDGAGFAGAALDVFSTEPLPESSRLWSHDAVVVSPHMSADFDGFDQALVQVFLDNLHRWKRAAPLAGVVDHQLGYVRSAT